MGECYKGGRYKGGGISGGENLVEKISLLRKVAKSPRRNFRGV